MDAEFAGKLAILVIGWVLGLGGTIGLDFLKRRKENKLGRTAILGELHDLRGVLAIAAYGVRTKQGTADRKFLEWLKAALENKGTPDRFDVFVGTVKDQLALSDEHLAALFARMVTQAGQGTVLQYYPVPLLDSRVSALWTFETTFQRKLLEIKQRLTRLDDLVDRSRKYFDMTFVDLDKMNRLKVLSNLDQVLKMYAENAERLAELMRSLED